MIDNVKKAVNEEFDKLENKINNIKKEIDFSKSSFRDIYDVKFGHGLVVNYDNLDKYSRSELISIRNFLDELYNLKKKIYEKELNIVITDLIVRDDVDYLWNNPRQLKRLIESISKVIVRKTIEHGYRTW